MVLFRLGRRRGKKQLGVEAVASHLSRANAARRKVGHPAFFLGERERRYNGKNKVKKGRQNAVWCEAMRRTVWHRVTGWALGVALVFGLSLGLDVGAVAQAGNAALPAAGAGAVKRLILTDGSYQAATEWKTVGERVEYYSAERSEWEEVPAALVDWKATEEWNADASKSQKETLKQESGEEIAARKEAELNTPQVAPKLAPELRLPPDGGVYVLEEVAGKPVLQKLAGNKWMEDDHEGSTLLKRSIIPIAGARQTVQLKGRAAEVRVHATGSSGASPSIFVDVENDQGVIEGGYFRIVRLERKREMRVVAENKIDRGGSESSKEMFLHSRAERFSGDWWKVIPLEELPPGEYAIVLDGVKDAEGGLVWDFGVDK